MIIKKYLLFLFFITSFLANSQTKKDSINSIELDELVVSSQRFSKSKRKISQQIESISKKEIEFQNFQTSADALGNSGTLAVQKSQQGGGSPIIRGFESSRILLLIDGVRMNNLIYRSGHLQNAITVDKNMLENIDVLFGPSSTIYGSDALGGAIYLQTKNPKLLDQTNNKKITGNTLTSYSTVNKSESIHFDINYADQKWASVTSFSYNNYGNLTMGKSRNGSNAPFGERNYYVTSINGIDTQVENEDKYNQKFSGYTQYDFMQKVLFKQNENAQHNLNIQFSTSTDIPRYDRLTDLNSQGNLRSAVWNYGPQDRFLSVYKLTKKNIFENTVMNLTGSYQNIKESRITRTFGSLNQTSRLENVNVFGITTDFKTKLGSADFIYGMDLYYDTLNSNGIRKNIKTQEETVTDSRYPDGKNATFRIESFASFSKDLKKNLTANTSLRAGYSKLNSQMDTNFLNLPFTTILQENITYSGAVGLVYNPSIHSKFVFNLATGFRVPNIDDLSKIFESVPGRVIVPNKDINPEQSITTDLSFTLRHGKIFQLENTIFYTRLFDAIVTAPYTINGQSSILYEGQVSEVYANQNQGKGNVFGISTYIKAYITPDFHFYGNFNYTVGQFENKTGKYPLDHIAPIFGKIGMKYDYKKLSSDLYILYNGKKKLEDYSPSGEDNLQYAPATGMPAWETYNFKIALALFEKITIYAGIENILDTQYRTFASGINAAGRNFYFGGKYSF